MNKDFYCVIMAGGVGSRFWPLSRSYKPKQFLDILGVGRTFLQMTYDRFVQIIAPENILVVTSDVYAGMVSEQLPDLPRENILKEPFKRNTAPCIAYATYRIRSINPNATMVVAPSDHVITNEALFLNTISSALEYASGNDKLITMGINPTRPETGYGYIQVNSKKVELINGNEVFDVKTFTEKPEAELAKVLVESGEFLWNSGIFVWNIPTIVSEFEQWLPEVAEAFSSCDCYCKEGESEYISKVYASCETISIDYGIMEKTRNAWVFKALFGWSDLGTWDSLYMYIDKDENGNIVNAANTMLSGVHNCAIYTDKSYKLMSLSGLDDYMVIDTDDVLMVCPRNEDNFKNMITDLAVKNKKSFQ